MKRSIVSRVLVYTFSLVLGVMIFHVKIGIDKLDPEKDEWLIRRGMDRTTDYLVWRYFYQTTYESIPDTLGYSYPQQVSPIYTNIMPLIAYPIKWLGPKDRLFQFHGWWYLFCFVLLLVCATWLLYSMGVRDHLLVCMGAVFFILNLTLFERIDHPGLTHHWTVVAACIPFFTFWDARSTWIWYMVLALIAATTHPYMLLFSIGIPMFYVLQRYMRAGKLSIWEWSMVPSCVLLTAVILWLLGAFAVDSSVAAESGFGFYSANFNTFYNNFNKTNAPLHFSTHHYGAYEGMAYLGVGALLLSLLVIVLRWKEKQKLSRLFSKHWLGLTLAVLAFSLFAFSHKWTFHQFLLIKWPMFGLEDLCSIFRSSGRYIWVLYYLFLAAIVYSWYHTSISLWSKRIILFLLVAIQLWDLYPALTYKIENKSHLSYFTDANWEEIVAPFSLIVCYPPYQRKLYEYDDVSHIIYLASKRGIPVSTGHLPRPNQKEQYEFQEQLSNYLQRQDTASSLFDQSLFITTKEFYAHFRERVESGALLVRESLDYLLLVDSNFVHREAPQLLKHTKPFDGENLTLLTNWLEENQRQEMLFISHDEATAHASDRFIRWMKERGSDFASLPFRYAYCGRMNKGKVVKEEMHKNAVTDTVYWGEYPVYVTSHGNATHTDSQIKVGEEQALSLGRGLTILGFTPGDSSVIAGHFDTYLSSALVREWHIPLRKQE